MKRCALLSLFAFCVVINLVNRASAVTGIVVKNSPPVGDVVRIGKGGQLTLGQISFKAPAAGGVFISANGFAACFTDSQHALPDTFYQVTLRSQVVQRQGPGFPSPDAFGPSGLLSGTIMSTDLKTATFNLSSSRSFSVPHAGSYTVGLQVAMVAGDNQYCDLSGGDMTLMFFSK